ncbi:MAG: ATP-binding protein [Candidatus Omnitrophota bacterium]
MTIKKKFIIFLCCFCALFLLGFFFFAQREEDNLRSFYHTAQADAEKNFEKILDLVTKSIKSYVYDYTYWDEMVNFIANKDVNWAKENIDTSLEGFKADFAWAYNIDLDLVYSTATPDSVPVDIHQILQQMLKEVFVVDPAKRFCNFFINTPSGVVEIHGASVQSGADVERTGPSQGYYLVGRLWDANFLKELSSITEMDVQVASALDPKDVLGQKNSNASFSFTRPLKDWRQKDISYLIIKASLPGMQQLAQTSRYHLTGIFIFVSILIILLVLLFNFFISRPLSLIARVLAQNDARSVQKLCSLEPEFKSIGLLINNFISQKENLSREVQQRKKAEDALLSVEPQQRAILNNISDMAWLKDRDGRFLAVNEAFARASGAGQEEMIGKTDLDIYPKELAEKYRADDAEVMRLGQRKSVEENFKDAKGNMLWIETVKTPVRNASGEIMGTTGIARDISQHRKEELEAQARQQELEQANQDLATNEKALKNILYDLKESQEQVARTQNQLFQSEKMSAVGELSAGVAHEIKNPLAIILLSAESLESRLGSMDDRTKNNIQMIKDGAERANKIIVELLNFSRHTELELKKESLHMIIDTALNLVSHGAKMKNIEIKREYGPQEDVTLMADSILLQQVFINLVNNAVDAMNDNGVIIFKAHLSQETNLYREHKVAVIEISDTGSGMSEAVAQKIFEPFFTTKEQGKGTGLGLSLAYTIIQGHNGSITVDSKVGVGTKFTIILPALS